MELYEKQTDAGGEYTYPSGRLTEGQIRLIDIHPGERGDKVKCSLRTTQRNIEVPYKALSYTWGDPNAEKKKISIDDRDFSITCNLHDALCRFRENEWSFSLWADAICINQADIVERNAQVQQMGEIFSEASQVIVWLGDAPNGSCALKDVEHLASLGAAATEDDVNARLASLSAVLDRPWFRRLWVLQEVILARECLVVFGSESCPIQSLYPLSSMAFHLSALEARVHKQTRGANKFVFGCHHLVDLKFYRDSLAREPGTLSVPYVYLTLIARSRNRLCQDPRDHIFGLLGIAKHLGLPTIQVNYDRSTREVYQNFMQQQLLRSASTLIYFEIESGRERAVDLPSWVPDFSTDKNAEPFAWDYFAGGRRNVFKLASDSFTAGGSELILSGYIFDRIRAQSGHQKMSMRHQTNARKIENFCLAAEDILSNDWTPNPYQNDAYRYQAYWRTLSANRYGYSGSGGVMWKRERIPTEDNGAAYEILTGRASAIPQHVNEMENRAVLKQLEGLRAQVVRAMKHRRLVVTYAGHFCCAPRTVEQEDLVVVIPGLHLPLIFRKRPTGIHHQLIGPAYVHGIMDGELMDSIKQSGHIEPEIFRIN